MKEKEEKVLGRYEMLWDCSFCGKTRLLGITHRHCPECGAPHLTQNVAFALVALPQLAHTRSVPA